LAAASIGLLPDIDNYLHLLVSPVLECFDDQESRVVYYACEAMYNITKVAKISILKYFNQIFDGLCRLFGHVDVDVKNGANLLDRLMKDIVAESATFDIESFVPLLQKQIQKTKPYIRQLLVSWIHVLNGVPDIALLDYLPEFLDGLFNMLSDGNREIRHAVDSVIGDFLKAIKQADVVEFGPMVPILVNQAISKEKFNRLRSLQWIHEFILLGGVRLRLFYADLLHSIIYCISDAEVDIVKAAKEANGSLMSLVLSTTESFALKPMLALMTAELVSDHVITRVTCLQWIKMLHEKDAGDMNSNMTELLPVLLKTLSDTEDEVLVINLHVLARISLDEVQFLRVLQALNQLFINDRGLLETRGALIIRKLCALLDCKSIFISLATILNDKSDLEYVSLMVQTLNLILLTAPELAPLRKLLKDCFSSAGNTGTVTAAGGATSSPREVFNTLFKCWCHNPVATFSLCLLAQAYDLSAQLVFKFADVDISVGFLMQVDKLIQLIESPIFLHLRLQLLDLHTEHHCELLKSLYGLLMLLPQSVAYKTLSERLSTISSLQMHLGFANQYGGYSVGGERKGEEKDKKKGKDKGGTAAELPAPEDYSELLDRFEYIQQKHSAFRLALLQKKTLLKNE
jgi:vacuole morphology and inheritance protein 14